MKKYLAFSLWLLAFGSQTAGAQHLLSLDSCRAMALRNNKQMGVSQLKQEVATNLRKSARTKYLPHVSAIGAYLHTSEEVSILNDQQKAGLSSLGTNVMGAVSPAVGQSMANFGTLMSQLGIPADAIQNMAGQLQQNMTEMSGNMNNMGKNMVDAFRTDTRNIWAGSVMVTQPVFMGGAIVALNRLADINEEMATNSSDLRRQGVLYSTDQAYWQVVSLKHKKRLAEGYLELVKKFDHDVQRMIDEGVATRSEGLSVSVKVNEAEMMLTKVDDGLVLSKMLWCCRRCCSAR